MTVTVPVIETDRLILRAQRIEDLDAMCAFYAEDRSKFVGGPMERVDVWRALMAGAGHWQLRGYGIWHITDRDSGKMAGFTGVLHHIDWPEPELAYSVFAPFEGHGIAHEAAEAARAAAAQHFGLTRLISLVAPDNDRSRALALRLGAHFEREETVRGHVAHVYRHPEITGAAT